VSYLQSGGNLYLAAEYNSFNSKNMGIGELLLTLGAVGEGYTACPGPSGNGLNVASAIRAANIPGRAPMGFYAIAVGGIPLQYLNGSNFGRSEPG
jgi:hypothetical protein